MSSSMPIPKRKQPVRGHTATPSWSSSAASSYASPSSSSPSAPIPSMSKGKYPATEERRYEEEVSPRRPSLLGSSLAKSEYTVIDLAHEDGPPRLVRTTSPEDVRNLMLTTAQVTCVKSSQGFDWNQELFLPSYADYDAQDLEHRQEPVQEIVLTDEEAAALMPR